MRKAQAMAKFGTYSILHKVFRWDVIAVLLVILISVGSLIPASDARAVPGNDFLKHAGLYGVLTYATFAAWCRNLAIAGLLMTSVVALGVGLEFLQPSVGRAFDLNDLVYNSIGTVAGATGFLIVKILR